MPGRGEDRKGGAHLIYPVTSAFSFIFLIIPTISVSLDQVDFSFKITIFQYLIMLCG